MGATQRLRADTGSPLRPAWRNHCDKSVAAARSTLGDDAGFEQAWQQGLALTLEQAIALADDSAQRH